MADLVRCRDCQFYAAPNVEATERKATFRCMRHPPRVVDGEKKTFCAWPYTVPYDGCGDGSRRLPAVDQWYERLERVKELDASLRATGDPDLRTAVRTNAQEAWILHEGVSRALEILEGK